jgi:hypothetical protein
MDNELGKIIGVTITAFLVIAMLAGSAGLMFLAVKFLIRSAM